MAANMEAPFREGAAAKATRAGRQRSMGAVASALAEMQAPNRKRSLEIADLIREHLPEKARKAVCALLRKGIDPRELAAAMESSHPTPLP